MKCWLSIVFTVSSVLHWFEICILYFLYYISIYSEILDCSGVNIVWKSRGQMLYYCVYTFSYIMILFVRFAVLFFFCLVRIRRSLCPHCQPTWRRMKVSWCGDRSRSTTGRTPLPTTAILKKSPGSPAPPAWAGQVTCVGGESDSGCHSPAKSCVINDLQALNIKNLLVTAKPRTRRQVAFS